MIAAGRCARLRRHQRSGLVYHDATASRETEHKLLQSQKLDAIASSPAASRTTSTTC